MLLQREHIKIASALSLMLPASHEEPFRVIENKDAAVRSNQKQVIESHLKIANHLCSHLCRREELHSKWRHRNSEVPVSRRQIKKDGRTQAAVGVV